MAHAPERMRQLTLPFGPEVGAVCGKAARTDLGGGREVTRVPTAKIRLLQCMSPQVAVRPEGANHQWRKNPPGELSIDPVADERLVRVTAKVGAS